MNSLPPCSNIKTHAGQLSTLLYPHFFFLQTKREAIRMMCKMLLSQRHSTPGGFKSIFVLTPAAGRLNSCLCLCNMALNVALLKVALSVLSFHSSLQIQHEAFSSALPSVVFHMLHHICNIPSAALEADACGSTLRWRGNWGGSTQAPSACGIVPISLASHQQGDTDKIFNE